MRCGRGAQALVVLSVAALACGWAGQALACFGPTITDCCDNDDDRFVISFGAPGCVPEDPVVIYFEWKIYDTCDTSGRVVCSGYDCITYQYGPVHYPVDCDTGNDTTTYMEVDAWYGTLTPSCSRATGGSYIGGDTCASTSGAPGCSGFGGC